jgi:hypothetical protein
MTRTMRAWRKANAFVRSGQHAKAAYWLCRTLETLDRDGTPRRRPKYVETDYLLAGLFVFVVILMTKG